MGTVRALGVSFPQTSPLPESQDPFLPTWCEGPSSPIPQLILGGGAPLVWTWVPPLPTTPSSLPSLHGAGGERVNHICGGSFLDSSKIYI